MRKLGLIAGGGQLPHSLADACQNANRPYFVIRLKGIADGDWSGRPGADVGLAELGKCFDALRANACEAVCFAGMVKRPEFRALKPDLRGLHALPAIAAAATKGDDALLRRLLAEFEKEGFVVEGADAVAASITLADGPVGSLRPLKVHQADIDLAVRTAIAMGGLDIGQAAVVAGGVVLAVEAQEGTDQMLARCLSLPANLRGTAQSRVGVLVKWPKPGQERRVDLPVIGKHTLDGAAAAGLAGIVGEAGGALLVDRAAVAAHADALDLFVVGLPKAQ